MNSKLIFKFLLSNDPKTREKEIQRIKTVFPNVKARKDDGVGYRFTCEYTGSDFMMNSKFIKLGLNGVAMFIYDIKPFPIVTKYIYHADTNNLIAVALNIDEIDKTKTESDYFALLNAKCFRLSQEITSLLTY